MDGNEFAPVIDSLHDLAEPVHEVSILCAQEVLVQEVLIQEVLTIFMQQVLVQK